MRDNPSDWRSALAAFLATLAIASLWRVDAGRANESALACLGDAGAVQTARDRLEMASVYLRHSRDNFGPARDWAIAATAGAILEFEGLVTGPKLEPSTEAKSVAATGRHSHPKMNAASGELVSLYEQLDGQACRVDARLDALRAKVAEAISAIREAVATTSPK